MINQNSGQNAGRLPELSEDATLALANAITIAGQMGHTYIGSEHLLCALVKNTQSTAGMLLARYNVLFRSLILQMKNRIGAANVSQLN